MRSFDRGNGVVVPVGALETHAIIFQREVTHCETGQETLFHFFHMQNTDNIAQEASYFKLRTDTLSAFCKYPILHCLRIPMVKILIITILFAVNKFKLWELT